MHPMLLILYIYIILVWFHIIYTIINAINHHHGIFIRRSSLSSCSVPLSISYVTMSIPLPTPILPVVPHIEATSLTRRSSIFCLFFCPRSKMRPHLGSPPVPNTLEFACLPFSISIRSFFRGMGTIIILWIRKSIPSSFLLLSIQYRTRTSPSTESPPLIFILYLNLCIHTLPGISSWGPFLRMLNGTLNVSILK